MTREERENFVRPLIAASGAHGLALEAIVTKIVDEWENDAEQAFTRGQENVWESQGAQG